MFFDVQTILMHKKKKFTDYFLCKIQSNGKCRVFGSLCIVAMETKFLLEYKNWEVRNTTYKEMALIHHDVQESLL